MRDNDSGSEQRLDRGVRHGEVCLRSAGHEQRRYPMPVSIYALDDDEPQIDETAYVAPDAVVIGRVTIGPEASVWPGAVLRGDHGYITVGARTSVQDGTIVHCTARHPTIIGDDCVVGHNAHLEGCVECRTAVTELAAVSPLLSALDYDHVVSLNGDGVTAATAAAPARWSAAPTGWANRQATTRQTSRSRP